MNYVQKYSPEEAQNIEYQLDILIECIQELEVKIPETKPIIGKYLDKIKNGKSIK